jgi:hypothetical protein
MLLLQGSREGQDAMVKLLQQGVPDSVVRDTCHLQHVTDIRHMTPAQVGNACVVIMQLANDAKDVACLQAFGRLGAIGALFVTMDVPGV